MDFFSKDTPSHTKNKTAPHEYQGARVKGIERQFNFTFSPWLHDLAMTVAEPIMIYAWMVQSEKYTVSWDEVEKTMCFTDFCNDQRWNYASWAMRHVKELLGRQIYDHFGKIKFSVNGVLQ